VLGVISSRPVAAFGPDPLPPQATALHTLNHYRALTGLPPVDENADWSHGNVLHAQYMLATGLSGHYEDPASPYYTAEGDAAARSSNLARLWEEATDRQFIEAWMAEPLHAIAMLRPGLQTTGFGRHANAAGLDVLRGANMSPPAQPVMYPGPGTTTHLSVPAIGQAEYCHRNCTAQLAIVPWH